MPLPLKQNKAKVKPQPPASVTGGAGAAPPPPVQLTKTPGKSVYSRARQEHRDGRTRSSFDREDEDFDIIIFGPKDAGKSADLLSLPGSKLFISFDFVTMKGLKNFAGSKKALRAEYDVLDILEVCKPDAERGYPGFNPNIPRTADVVVGETFTILEEYMDKPVAERPDWVILDHFHAFFDEVARAYMYFKLGLPPGDEVDSTAWEYRNATSKMLISAARMVARTGHVLSGYGAVEKLTFWKEANGKTKAEMQEVMPTWMDKFIRDYPFILHATSTQTLEDVTDYKPDGNRNYHIQVMTSKDHELFPIGERLDVTNVGVGAFWNAKAERDAAVAEIAALEGEGEQETEATAEAEAEQLAGEAQ